MVNFHDKMLSENAEASSSTQRLPASFNSSSSSKSPESISIAGPYNLHDSLSRMNSILLANILLEALTVVALEATSIYYYVLYYSKCVLSIANLGLSLARLTYHQLVILAQIYQLMLYIDVLMNNNIPQLCMTMLFQILILAFTIIPVYPRASEEFTTCNGPLDRDSVFSTVNSPSSLTESDVDFYKTKFLSLDYARLGVTLTCSIIFLLGFGRICRDYIWKNHYLYSFDDRVRKAIIAISSLGSLLKFDAYFCLLYTAQLVPAAIVGYPIHPWEILVVITAFTFSLLLGWWAIQKENYRLIATFITTTILFFGYFVYRMVSLSSAFFVNQDNFKIIRYGLQFSIITTLVFVLSTTVVGLICLFNKSRGINLPHSMCQKCVYPENKPSIIQDHPEPPHMAATTRSGPKQSTDTYLFSDCHSVIT